MNSRSYRVIFRKEPEGGFTAIVPSLPGCITYGENLDEAISMVHEAIELYIDSLIANDEEIPTDKETFEYTVNLEYA